MADLKRELIAADLKHLCGLGYMVDYVPNPKHSVMWEQLCKFAHYHGVMLNSEDMLDGIRELADLLLEERTCEVERRPSVYNPLGLSTCDFGWYCSECGGELGGRQNIRFCWHCGAKVVS